MRHFNRLVYDEYVGNAVASAPAYTSADHNLVLGQYDQLAFHFIVDNGGAGGTIAAQLEHSGDGRIWIIKNNAFQARVSRTTSTVVIAASYHRWRTCAWACTSQRPAGRGCKSTVLPAT